MSEVSDNSAHVISKGAGAVITGKLVSGIIVIVDGSVAEFPHASVAVKLTVIVLAVQTFRASGTKSLLISTSVSQSSVALAPVKNDVINVEISVVYCHISTII